MSNTVKAIIAIAVPQLVAIISGLASAGGTGDWYRQIEKPSLIAFADIILLWCAIGLTVFLFFRQSATAGALLVPYWGWVSFASVLNFYIWRLNV